MPTSAPQSNNASVPVWTALSPEVDPGGRSGLVWSEAKNGLLLARLPLPPGSRGKHCKVEFKRNWLTVVAPAGTSAGAPAPPIPSAVPAMPAPAAPPAAPVPVASVAQPAPPTRAAAPPTPAAASALLDFQLFGAVDSERSDWRVDRTAAGEAWLLLEMQKSPVYDWCVSGLTKKQK